MGDGYTGPARCAHPMNGSQGGPPNGKCAAPPKVRASRETTRRLQRSRASGPPSFASSDAAKTGHIPGPAFPTRTSVAAGVPSANGGTASSAATWNAPRLASPSVSTATTTASKDRAGDSLSRTEPFTPWLGRRNGPARLRLGRTGQVPSPPGARARRPHGQPRARGPLREGRPSPRGRLVQYLAPR